MSFVRINMIPSPAEIITLLPLSAELKRIKAGRDKEITAVFTGKSKKFIVIIGPCSADDETSVCLYTAKLAKLQERVKGELLLVPRIYTNKPRTTGEGYKGMMHQPDPSEEPDIVRGIKALRRMHIRALGESGLTAADEMLYPGNYPYLEDLLSYVAIGARSVENQEHRLTVSGLDIPVGMKNPTSGDLTVMLNSVQAAQLPHVFVYNGFEVQTTGNLLAHCILRGAVNQYGQSIPNYHYEDLIRLAEIYKKRMLKHPAIIVDVNHANSNKDYAQQPRIALHVLHSMKSSSLLNDMVKGLMIESYLIEGAQGPMGRVRGKSITDPCLGWKDSERLVLDLAARIAKLR